MGNVANASQFNEDFIRNCKEESDEGYLLEVDVQYLENLHELCNDLPSLPESRRIEKVENPVTNLHDKTEYVIHIRNLKQASNHGFVFEKVYKVIKFNQSSWLKPHIDMNADLRKKEKNDFEKDFFNNAVLEKTMENMRKHRDIQLATTERSRNYLVLGLNHHTTIFFIESLLVIEMKKQQRYL